MVRGTSFVGNWCRHLPPPGQALKLDHGSLGRVSICLPEGLWKPRNFRWVGHMTRATAAPQSSLMIGAESKILLHQPAASGYVCANSVSMDGGGDCCCGI